jgi:cytochrome c biogenesis protein CcdA
MPTWEFEWDESNAFVMGSDAGHWSEKPARRVTIATAWFVLGFGAVFTALGAGAGAISDLLREHRRTLEVVSGGPRVAVNSRTGCPR